MPNLLSDKRIVTSVVIYTGENNDVKIEVPLLYSKEDVTRLTFGDFKITYHLVYCYDKQYAISNTEYKRIYNAIEKGAKFVQLNTDLVNVNQIKKFEEKDMLKKFYKYTPVGGTMKEELDENSINKFMEELGMK